MFSYKRTILSVLILVAIGGSFFAGVYAGYEGRPEVEKVTALLGKEDMKPAMVDFDAFWKAWNVINEKYVSNNGATDQEKVWGAIEGLASSLDDPYTVFFPPEEHKMFESDIKGEFQGVGMEIGIRDNILTVIAPLKDTPAERAGMRPGDMVIKIDDTISSDLTIDEAVRLIRGPKGEEVVLTIVREGNGEPIEIRIVRDVIKIPTAATTYHAKDGSVAEDPQAISDSPVFTISLYNFSAQSANIFRESLQEFVDSGKTKLILDLRGNPGGYLESAVDMASWFLPEGKVIVRESLGNGEEGRIYRSKGYDIFNDNLEVVILVNSGSASASEILAGALSEHDVATIVGIQTFGKGSVQELVSITKDTSLKVTVARWLTPNGVSISKEGITPDVEVKITAEDFEAGKDPQMAKAIELLTN
ncbi:S41 family peptidase [Patescibacteria group bacterium]